MLKTLVKSIPPVKRLVNQRDQLLRENQLLQRKSRESPGQALSEEVTRLQGKIDALRLEREEIRQSKNPDSVNLGLKSSAPFSLIFCVGAPRSGTTLLHALLSGGEAYPMTPECDCITRLISEYKNTIDMADGPRRETYIGSEEKLADAYKKTIYELILRAENSLGVKRKFFALKNPELSHHVDVLNMFFGDNYKTICIVRDPRDVVASLVSVFEKLQEAYVFEEQVDYIHRNLLSTHNAAREADPRMIYVKYEDLVADSRACLGALEGFLGYAVRQEDSWETSFKFDKNSAWHAEHWDKPISKSRVGMHKERLAAEQNEYIAGVFADIMDRYGYR